MLPPEKRLNELGLKLPAPTTVPEGLHLPFSFVNVRGDRVIFSGHPKNAANGSIAGPFGVLGTDLTTKQGYAEAREVALTVLANIKAEIGDLSRIVGWSRVFGMVTSAPGYTEQHLVVNGLSDLVIEVFGFFDFFNHNNFTIYRSNNLMVINFCDSFRVSKKL